MKTVSLQKRFFFNTALVAIIVMSISTLLIDLSYRHELEKSAKDKLKLHIFNLLSVAEYKDGKLELPVILANPSFNTEQSDLWALVLNNKKQVLWQSLSINDTPNSIPTSNNVGEWTFSQSLIQNTEYLTASYAITWENKNTYHLLVGQNTQVIINTVQEFRTLLFSGFLSITIFLLAIQLWALQLTFKPIKKLEAEISNLEKGQQGSLLGNYPLELSGVSKNLNALIKKEHKQKEKYRGSMADLAHSLKTPIAIIKSELSKQPNNATLNNALMRMNDTIEYQLKRAVISGHNLLSKGTHIEKTMEQVLTALHKIHQDKNLDVDIKIDENLIFLGDENDLMEILGNLLDNAFKYAKQNIHICAQQSEHTLKVYIEDDGPGIPAEMIKDIFNRGKRLDESNSGQGIGLAVVKNIVEDYQGQVETIDSKLGGAKFIITLPTGDTPHV